MHGGTIIRLDDACIRRPSDAVAIRWTPEVKWTRPLAAGGNVMPQDVLASHRGRRTTTRVGICENSGQGRERSRQAAASPEIRGRLVAARSAGN